MQKIPEEFALIRHNGFPIMVVDWRIKIVDENGIRESNCGKAGLIMEVETGEDFEELLNALRGFLNKLSESEHIDVEEIVIVH